MNGDGQTEDDFASEDMLAQEANGVLMDRHARHGRVVNAHSTALRAHKQLIDEQLSSARFRLSRKRLEIDQRRQINEMAKEAAKLDLQDRIEQHANGALKVLSGYTGIEPEYQRVFAETMVAFPGAAQDEAIKSLTKTQMQMSADYQKSLIDRDSLVESERIRSQQKLGDLQNPDLLDAEVQKSQRLAAATSQGHGEVTGKLNQVEEYRNRVTEIAGLRAALGAVTDKNEREKGTAMLAKKEAELKTIQDNNPELKDSYRPPSSPVMPKPSGPNFGGRPIGQQSKVNVGGVEISEPTGESAPAPTTAPTDAQAVADKVAKQVTYRAKLNDLGDEIKE